MAVEKDQDRSGEMRREPRFQAGKYVSVEFCPDPLEPVYIFRVRDESASGLAILVKEGSSALKRLEVGLILNMIYRGPRRFDNPVNFKTRVVHITKNDDGQFKGHYVVGLDIIEGQLRN